MYTYTINMYMYMFKCNIILQNKCIIRTNNYNYNLCTCNQEYIRRGECLITAL